MPSELYTAKSKTTTWIESNNNIFTSLLKRIFAIIALIIATQACSISYKFNGSAIDYNKYKTVSVGEFPIRAALVYPPLQQLFENTVTDMITRQTRLKMQEVPNTDIRIEGEITGYNLSPQAVTENAYASKTRLSISVRVKYIDNVDPEKEMDQTFSAYRDFDSSELLTDVQDQLCDEICKELAELIFNQTFGNW